MLRATVLIPAVILLSAAPSHAKPVPPTLTQQGRLLNADGTPATGQVTLKFAVYADATTSTALWSESQTVTLDDGYFSVQLGATAPFPAMTFDGSARFLGLTVGSDSEMAPREELTSVPYALVAQDAIGDIHPSSATVTKAIGIGVSPLYPLHVESAVPNDVVAAVHQTDATGYGMKITPGNDTKYALAISNAAQSGNVTELFGNGDAFFGGKVGVNTSTPADQLQVGGDIRVGTGTTGCVKDADGTVIAGTCSSDLRLKKDVVPFSNVLDKVTQLQPVHFYWKRSEHPAYAFGASRSFGLVAQDVEKVLPELVTKDGNGYKAVRYNELPFMMLQAIKEQQAEIASLRAENKKLHDRLAHIGMFEQRLSRLEKAARMSAAPRESSLR